MAEQQIKSKQRVAEHGEVMTGEREVNAMLDLVKQETERIESRFLDMKTPKTIQLNYSSVHKDGVGTSGIEWVHFAGRVQPGCFCW